MFDIEGRGAYKWHSLFLALSLERVTLFLGDISLPISEHIHVIRHLALPMAMRFREIELGQFSHAQMQDLHSELFAETYVKLTQQVGLTKAAAFCAWGNALPLYTPVEDTLFNLWDRMIVKFADEPVPNLPDLSMDGALWLKVLAIRYKAELLGVIEASFALEKLPRNDMDEELYKFYNLPTLIEGTELSPLITFSSIFEFVKLRKAFSQIKQILNSDDFASFIHWLNSEQFPEPRIDITMVFDICTASESGKIN